MTSERFDRQIRFFGREGQETLRAARVAVVGLGGLGSHVVQQLALSGVGHLALVDSEELAATDLNRSVGAHFDDPIPGTRKCVIAERTVRAIDPSIGITIVPDSVVNDDAFVEVIAASHVFGCLDSEGARVVLNELCAAYERPYVDLASDMIPGSPPAYGGRVCSAWDGQGCIVCLGLLDVAEAQAELAGPGAAVQHKALYGVDRTELGTTGPSVVSLNGVVASLAVTEFMLAVTGIRPPKRLLTYHGDSGKVTVSTDEPVPDCYYCRGIRGKRDAADVHRYLREGVGRFLR